MNLQKALESMSYADREDLLDRIQSIVCDYGVELTVFAVSKCMLNPHEGESEVAEEISRSNAQKIAALAESLENYIPPK